MDLNKEQYQELVEKLAQELVFGDMEKTAGAGAAGFGAKKINDHVKEASDALIEAILYKQAALNEKEEAMLVAEASEKALNTLGYSMFAEQ